MRLSAALALSALVAVAACKKEVDYSQATPAKTSTTTTEARNAAPEQSSSMNPITPPQSSIPASRPAPAATAESQVDLLEYSIHMQPSYPAGQQTFTVVNAGKENHGLVIEGNGTQVKLANELSRGDRGSLTLNLQPGTYTAWCPVDGHKGKGMSTSFTVR